mgnify:CR=1 FL=1
MGTTNGLSVNAFFRENEKAMKLKWVAGKNGGDRQITE